MYKVSKLKRMPYAQARVVETDDGIILISYETIVCVIDKHENTLTCNGLFSNTTRKHISAFMKEYTNYTYYDAKKCFWDCCDLNLTTGDFVSLETGEILNVA